MAFSVRGSFERLNTSFSCYIVSVVMANFLSERGRAGKVHSFVNLTQSVTESDSGAHSQLLIEAGADVDATNSSGNTATHIACLNGHDEGSNLLISSIQIQI